MRIELPCYGIVMEINGNGGSIGSELKEEISDLEDSTERQLIIDYNNMMDALEAMILAHAISGINVESPAYIEGIETAVQACAQSTL